MLEKQAYTTHQQEILKWFRQIFSIASILFCLALIPALIQMRNTASDLQAEKRKQLLNSGADKLSSSVTGILNISQSLLMDSRFAFLHYPNADYSEIPVTTQYQLRKTLDDLSAPLDLPSRIILQLDQAVAISDTDSFSKNASSLQFYPDFFQADDLSYEEWIQLLSDTKTGFLPVCHIKTSSEYDALVFVTPWGPSGYLYSYINVTNLKKELIEEANLNNCYFTITSSENQVLYSDLPKDAPAHQTFNEVCSAGNVTLSVHIPNSIFMQDMRPFYLFFAVYIIAFATLLVFVSAFNSKRAAEPILNIIEILEHSRIVKPATSDTSTKKSVSGFDYISNSIINADQNLKKYQFVLQSQRKLLQTRFLEKALNGQLASQSDIRDFHTYFADFPKSYHLLLVKLWTYTTGSSTTLYPEPLLLLQSFLETECPDAFQHQINDTELLLILSQEDYIDYSDSLTFLICNINKEEPTYHASCIASTLCYGLDNLPAAFQQVLAMAELPFSDYQTRICTTADYIEEAKIPVAITDLMTLYTAITSGNSELAMSRLTFYSEELTSSTNAAFIKPVFEMIRSILTYVKVDYSQLLAENHIPRYELGKNLYEQLAETVENFCTLICEYNNLNKDSFTQELFNYIDTHYADPDICLTSLKTYFKCSESTIRKVFKRVTNVPIARYIEQKRMVLANELLAQGEKTVTEIALECGYLLPHSFYKAYKRVYGYAPTLTGSTSRTSS